MGWVNSLARKTALIQQAKNRPCADCLAEGRRADWPREAMTLDHLPGCVKTMEMSGGSDKCAGRRTGGMRPYSMFTVRQVRDEIANCEPVCANHHNVRTCARNRARGSHALAAYSEAPTLFAPGDAP
jgi:hypothetical protein